MHIYPTGFVFNREIEIVDSFTHLGNYIASIIDTPVLYEDILYVSRLQYVIFLHLKTFTQYLLYDYLRNFLYLNKSYIHI